MSQQLLFAFSVEIALVGVTSLLLVQPKKLFGSRVRPVFKASGWILLCLTFCWSVILGGVLALHSLVA